MRPQSHIILCDTYLVTDPGQNSLSDAGFVGGTAKYRLQVSGYNRLSATDEEIYVSAWQPGVAFEWLNAQEARFKWRKNPYHENVSKISFTPVATPFNYLNSSDTTFLFHDPNFRFGKSIDFQLRISSKRRPEDFYISSKTLFIGEPCHRSFAGARYNKVTAKWYQLSPSVTDTLYVFGDDKINPLKIPLSKEGLKYDLSPDGKSIFILFRDEIVKRDAATLQFQQSYSFSSLSGNPRGMGHEFTVTSNNRVLVYFEGSPSNTERVIDLGTMTILYSSSIALATTISPDGNQLFSQGQRYVWDGSSYAPTGKWFYSPSLQEYQIAMEFPGDSLVTASSGHFAIRNSKTGQAIKLISSTPVAHYDHYRQTAALTRNGKFEWIDLNTDVIKYLPVDTKSAFFSLSNKFLICSKGFYLQLD